MAKNKTTHKLIDLRKLISEADQELTKLEKGIDKTRDQINKEKNNLLDQWIKLAQILKGRDL